MNSDPAKITTVHDRFLSLMDENHPEQVYQRFMEENTCLIPREFIQNHGIHFDLVLRKLSLAKDYAPDFFYLSKSSADWNLVLIEIEKPRSRYFKGQSNNLHPEFLAGLDQIARWRAWFDNPANLTGFTDGTIAPIRKPMARNPCHIKYVLVHGRRSEFEGSELRRGLIRAREAEDFHIISFDSLLESLHSKGPLYLGIRKNEYVEIVSEEFVGESIFSWMEPTQLRISEGLRADIIRNKANWRHHRTKGGGKVLESVLPTLGRCDALTQSSNATVS
ncbi:Shedu immune nuclease family protein [Salinispirillum marinum]|uniref:Shedu immune nuclease family protein n=2 Tax=Saccharospirillaceae TaxID=255527 RepID=A0ABV8BJV1_9GAMM